MHRGTWIAGSVAIAAVCLVVVAGLPSRADAVVGTYYSPGSGDTYVRLDLLRDDRVLLRVDRLVPDLNPRDWDAGLGGYGCMLPMAVDSVSTTAGTWRRDGAVLRLRLDAFGGPHLPPSDTVVARRVGRDLRLDWPTPGTTWERRDFEP